MWKFLFLALVLWQGINEIVGDNVFGQIETDSGSIFSIADQKTADSEKINSNTDGRRHYDLHVGSIIFNLTVLLPQKKSVPSWVDGLVDVGNTPGAGYLVTSGIGAHKLHLRKLPWNKARQICIEEGGHLAVIRSVSEENIVLQMLAQEKLLSAWLGVHDNFEEGDWITVMDEPLARTGWAKWSKNIAINPDNSKGNENCAELYTYRGGMNDNNCNVSLPFICKISNI